MNNYGFYSGYFFQTGLEPRAVYDVLKKALEMQMISNGD